MLFTPLGDGNHPEFIHQTTAAIEQAMLAHQTDHFWVVQIDNWFGRRWYRFGGKILGALGFRDFRHLLVPPFVPSRVVAQGSWRRHGTKHIRWNGPPVHRRQTSERNRYNTVARVADSLLMAWFSSRSAVVGRGALMLYVRTTEGESGVYAEATAKCRWQLRRLEGDSALLPLMPAVLTPPTRPRRGA